MIIKKGVVESKQIAPLIWVCIGCSEMIIQVFPVNAVLLITTTHLYNFDPLKPHFYLVKLGFTEVYSIFLILLNSIDCGYSLELLCRGGSNKYNNLCFEKNYEKYQNSLSENFNFLVVKFPIYLNRCIFVMTILPSSQFLPPHPSAHSHL